MGRLWKRIEVADSLTLVESSRRTKVKLSHHYQAHARLPFWNPNIESKRIWPLSLPMEEFLKGAVQQNRYLDDGLLVDREKVGTIQHGWDG